MGRKRSAKVVETVPVEKPPKKKDRWTEIEENNVTAASSVLFVESEDRPRTRNYERLRPKMKRISDGENVKHLLMNKNSSKKSTTTPKSALPENETIVVGSSTSVKPKKSIQIITLDETANSQASSKGNSILKQNETCGTETLFASKKSSINGTLDSSDMAVEENMEGLESDESIADEELELSIDEEEEEQELEDEEIFEDAMRIDPSDIMEIVDDGEDANEQVEDEERDDEDEQEEEDSDSDMSVVSDQDAMSDEEAASISEPVVNVIVPAGKKSIKSSPTTNMVDFDAFPFTTEDSVETAARAFAFIIKNADTETFFKEIYQKQVYMVNRGNPKYYGNLFSTSRIFEMLKKNHLEYTTNVNIAEYKNGVRTTLNGTGRVYPHVLKEHLDNKRSMQIVNPQAFDDHIWYVCEILQELFNCFVGANTYLTPAGSSGFAPHWDEIDAFLLQVEGRKYWRVWAPETSDEQLPRESSGNFTEEDMRGRTPTFEGWVSAGDLIYIPRGFIHQAKTCSEVHSLHVTISTGRNWSYADLLEKLVPEAVTALAVGRKKMRQTLPVGLLDMSGVADIDYPLEEFFGEKFVMHVDRHLSMLRNKIADEFMESGIDMMAKEFFKGALPPRLTPKEESLSALGSNSDLLDGELINFDARTKVRLMRKHNQRLLFTSEDSCYLAHRLNNSRSFEGRPEQTIDFPVAAVPVFACLYQAYPEWKSLEKIFSDKETKKVPRKTQLAAIRLLFASGLLLVNNGSGKK